MNLNVENKLNVIKWGGGGVAGSMQVDRRFVFMKIILTLGGFLPLPRGYIHVYDHNIQTSFSLKPLGQLKPNFMWRLIR